VGAPARVRLALDQSAKPPLKRIRREPVRKPKHRGCNVSFGVFGYVGNMVFAQKGFSDLFGLAQPLGVLRIAVNVPSEIGVSRQLPPATFANWVASFNPFGDSDEASRVKISLRHRPFMLRGMAFSGLVGTVRNE
jgi:hypothetical protein